MNILLTGGLGFIGSHTVVELVNSGNNVVIYDNLSNSKIEVLNKLYKLCDKNKITFIKGDILNLDELKQLNNYKIDTVVHFAAFKSVNESIKLPLEYYQNNITGLLNLLNYCNTMNINNFIFSSSTTVYGNSISPLFEDSNIGIGISNPYGQTKYMGEQILKDFSKSQSKFNIICLRYFNPVGAHKSGLIGEDPNDIPNNLMPYVLRVAVKNNLNSNLDDVYNYLSIYGSDYDTPDGTCQRDFIHVVDLAKAHVAAVKKIGSFDNFEVFNIGTGKGTSVLEIVESFRDINNIKLPYVMKDRRPGDNAVTFCDCQKANKMLEWKADLDINDICLDTYNFAKSNN